MYVKTYLKLDQLIVGRKYRGIGRNFNEATWNGEAFEGMRTKFGSTFLDTELHYDSDPSFGTFQPLEEILDGEEEGKAPSEEAGCSET